MHKWMEKFLWPLADLFLRVFRGCTGRHRKLARCWKTLKKNRRLPRRVSVVLQLRWNREHKFLSPPLATNVPVVSRTTNFNFMTCRLVVRFFFSSYEYYSVRNKRRTWRATWSQWLMSDSVLVDNSRSMATPCSHFSAWIFIFAQGRLAMLILILLMTSEVSERM